MNAASRTLLLQLGHRMESPHAMDLNLFYGVLYEANIIAIFENLKMCCYPSNLDKFPGPRTHKKVVLVGKHKTNAI